MKRATTICFVAALIAACGSDTKRTGSETHWLSCQTTEDCNDGFVCSAERCLPQDEVNNTSMNASNQTANNGTTSTNNGTTGSNNATSGSNNATSGSNNATSGSNNTVDICPERAEPEPTDLPAVTDVTFQLTNNYATDIWVPRAGWFCDSWGIDGVSLAMGFQCGCECPFPGGASVQSYQRIAVGETLDLTWDGRGLVTYEQCLDCSDWGSGEASTEIAGVRQPVAAGDYTFRMHLIFDVPPDGCVDVAGDGIADCGDPDPDPTDGLPPAISQMCDVPTSSFEAVVPFVVPAAGPMVVPVSLP